MVLQFRPERYDLMTEIASPLPLGGCMEMSQLLQRPRGLGASFACIMDCGRSSSTYGLHLRRCRVSRISGRSLGP